MVKRYIDVFLEKDANIILEITKINGYMPPKKKIIIRFYQLPADENL